MEPLAETQVQGGTEEGEDKRFSAENGAPVDDCVPHALENGDQASINPSAHHISPEQIKNDKKIAARDPFSMPLVVAKADGTRGVLWAVLDTGASSNFITKSLVEKLGHIDALQEKDPPVQIKTGDGITTLITHYLPLTFHARDDERCYQNVEFLVEQEDRIEDANSMSTTPHLFLGWPWMHEHHVLMLDEQFATKRFDGLEVIEPEPEHEHGMYSRTRVSVLDAFISPGPQHLQQQRPTIAIQNPRPGILMSLPLAVSLIYEDIP